MPFVDTIGLLVKRNSFSSALMCAVAYGHMQLKPSVTFLRFVPDDISALQTAAEELERGSFLFRQEGEPLYVMTFGLSPEAADAINVDFKLDDLPCVLLPVTADAMPHHSFTPEQIRRMGEYFDEVDAEEFIFHTSRRIREEDEDYDPCTDNVILDALQSIPPPVGAADKS